MIFPALLTEILLTGVAADNSGLSTDPPILLVLVEAEPLFTCMNA